MMKTEFLEILDLERINTLLEGFNKSTGFVTAILDLEGSVLTKSGWRGVCVDFHRVHPVTKKKCHISDTVLSAKMAQGEKYHFYRCLNGLMDVAVPIVINGKHIANLFSGQFFTEPPNIDFFTRQAKRMGFDLDAYLEKVREVPVVDEGHVRIVLDFLLNMTEVIAEMSLQRLEQLQLNEALQYNQELLEAQNRQLQLAMDKSEQSELLHQSILQTSMDGFVLIDSQLHILEVNDAFAAMTGYSKQELLTMSVPEIEANETPEQSAAQVQKIKAKGFDRFVTKHRRKDGSIYDVEVTVQYRPSENGQVVVFIRDITEMVMAREAVERSERVKSDLLVKFNEAQQSAKIGNWDWDLLSGKVWWSDEMYRIMDLVPGEYIPTAEDIPKFIHPDDLTVYIPQINQAIETNTELNTIVRILSEKGTLKYCHSREKFERDAQGSVVRFYGTLADVTEQKKVEQSLQQSEDRLFKIFHSSPSAIIVTSLDEGRFIDMNEATARIFGYQREELIGRTSLEMGIIGPEERRKLANAMAVDGSLESCEIVIQSKDQGPRTVLYSMEIIPINEESFVLTSMIDITERKRVEEALMRSEQELRTLAESMPQIVWIAYPDGRNIYFNQQWVNYTGLSREESYGDGWIILYHPDDHQRAWAAWHHAVATSEIYSVECRLRRQDGIYRWFLVRGVPIVDDSGIIIKWFGTCTDIEEIKSAENKIRDQLDELRRWHNVTMDRESRILELKNEVNELLREMGLQARYGSYSYLAEHE